MVGITRRGIIAAGAVLFAAPAIAQSAQWVVMTGHMGNIGSRLADSFSVVGIDKKAGPQFDLSQPNWAGSKWRDRLQNIKAVIHLATVYGDGKMDEQRDEDMRGNINLLQACIEYGVKRIVFATSTWAKPAEYRPDYKPGDRLTLYGESKLAMERALGAACDARLLESAISLRIGHAPHNADDIPFDSANRYLTRTDDLVKAFAAAASERFVGYREVDVRPLRPIAS